MERIINKLSQLRKKAEEYTRKRNQSLRDVGYGMIEVINEIESIVNVESTPIEIKKLMKTLKHKVIYDVGIEGSPRDMELHYDGVKLCDKICDGGRTNLEYFTRLINYLEDYGYKRNKFDIVVGNHKYNQ